MSNSKQFAEEIFAKRKFLSIEHGTSVISLDIIESPPHKSMGVLLSIKEAEKIVADLQERINEILEGEKL